MARACRVTSRRTLAAGRARRSGRSPKARPGISSFSNYGATTIDIGAPGSSIYSTVPKSAKGKIVSGFVSYNGISMATPHVSGAAALHAAYNPGSSAATIKSAILGSAVATASLSGKPLPAEG